MPVVQDNQRWISLIHDLHIWTPLTSEHLWIHCHTQSHHSSWANFLSGDGQLRPGWFVQLLTLASFLSGWIAQLLTLASFLSGSTFWSDDNTPEDGQPHSFHILSQKIAFCLKDLALSFQPKRQELCKLCGAEFWEKRHVLLDQSPKAVDYKIGQWYPCELNIEDQCRSELGRKARGGCAEGDAKNCLSSSVILLRLILVDRRPEAEFVQPFWIDLRCVERVEQFRVKNTGRWSEKLSTESMQLCLTPTASTNFSITQEVQFQHTACTTNSR